MKLDKFTQAYIQTALWSSTEYQHGECPCCGRNAILSHLPEPEYEQTPMCNADGCGVREISNPPPMDDNYSQSDIAPEAMEKIVADCAKFQADNSQLLSDAIAAGVKCGPNFDATGRAGHDFWLTRNGHGAGFWDGDWADPFGDKLTDAAKSFGECSLYAGDDGQLYLS